MYKVKMKLKMQNKSPCGADSGVKVPMVGVLSYWG